ncbi:MAG: anaerobic ribonucleoside-triphosphate reductase activating protein [Thomasclavelia sp.]|uniref:anaerobic ribonucleoside-triphosphate reductase activating protein n=1 Tax=Thomasclavelia sp. TaxID=3025757 RepID=UPI0039A26489
MKIRLFGTANDSIVDGPGLRYTIFTQGCYHKCMGCHNPKSHDINGGYLKDINEIIIEIDENPLLDGITLSGGEPMLQIEPLIEICKEVKQRGLSIVIYSGFTFEQIVKDSKMKSLLELCDMLIDGKFEQDKKSLSLLYRGSSNQRLINIQESLRQAKVIEYDVNEYNEIMI